MQSRHPNLLQFICATENDKHNILIVTELMDASLRTSLEQRESERSPLEYHEIKLISLDVVSTTFIQKRQVQLSIVILAVLTYCYGMKMEQ